MDNLAEIEDRAERLEAMKSDLISRFVDLATETAREETDRDRDHEIAVLQDRVSRLSHELDGARETNKQLAEKAIQGEPLPYRTRHVRVFCACGREMVPCPTSEEIRASGENLLDWGFVHSEHETLYGQNERRQPYYRAETVKVRFICPTQLDYDTKMDQWQHSDLTLWVQLVNCIWNEDGTPVFGPDKKEFKGDKRGR
jgi:hypothetical protein